MKKIFIDYFTLPLVLLAPFIFFIKYNQYPFWHLEILLLALAIILVGLAASYFKKIFPGVGWLMINSLVIIVALSYFTHGKHAMLLLIAITFLLFILMFFLTHHFDEILLVTVCIFILATILFSIQSDIATPFLKAYATQKSNKHLPPIFHILLDAHIGINGLPDTKNSQVLRNKLIKFYTAHGFRFYTNAYSHYVRTYNSIPNLLNFTNNNLSEYYVSTVNNHHILKQNKYFTLLHQAGYQIRVYQSGYLQYCAQSPVKLAACYTYPYASIKAIEDLNISVKNKMLFIFKNYLLQFSLYQYFVNSYQYKLRPFLQPIDIQLPEWRWYQARTASIYMPQIFQQLKHDANKNAAGVAFYAHILSPHNPYIYDANCHIIKRPQDWRINIGPDPFANSTATRTYRYRLYENQLRCVTKQLQSFFADLKQHHLYKKSIIIINADHGSRIMIHPPYRTNKNKLNRQDFKDAFMALFAVKAPGFATGIVNKPLSLQAIFSKIIGRIAGKDIKVTKTTPYFYLISKKESIPMQRMYLSDL